MRVIIGRPQDWIDKAKRNPKSIWFGDVELLYDNIEIACMQMGINYNTINCAPLVNRSRDGEIFLGHHTHGIKKNIWHIKKGYIPNYMYWDKTGYSGWSELAEYYDKTYQTEQPTLTVFRAEEYINTNTSKIPQPDEAKIPAGKYVLVLGQRPHDSVAAHAYIDTIQLAELVNIAYEDTEYTVFTKPHPMSLQTKFYGRKIEGSLHKLIAGAAAIYTTNSGAGFESLFHYKRVFVSGNCDYKWACVTVRDMESIKRSVEMVVDDVKVDENKITNFLDYCFTHHFVKCNDLDSIKRKLQRCISEYEV